MCVSNLLFTLGLLPRMKSLRGWALSPWAFLLANCSVNCTTDLNFGCMKFKFFAYMYTCNMCAHLLFITVVSLYLVAIVIFHIYALYFVTISETKYLSYVCTNVGSKVALQLLCFLTDKCNMATIFAQWYMSDMCTVLIITWLIAVTSYVAHTCWYI